MTAHAYWRIKIITYGGGSAGSGFANLEEINFTDANGSAFSRSGATGIDSAHFSGTTFDAAKAVDANTGTTWSGNPTGWPAFWLGIQYASPVDAFGVQMTDNDSSAPITFDVEYSDDGITWTNRASGLSASTWSSGGGGFGADAVLVMFDTPSGSGSHAYWRCLVAGKRRFFGGGNYYGNLGGLGFYDASNTLLSTGGTAIDSANFGTAPSGVFGSPTSAGSLWSGDFNAFTFTSGPAWIGYHHGSNVAVHHVEMYAYLFDASNFLGFYLQYSDDGTTWVTHTYFPDFTNWTAGEHRTYTISAVSPSATADMEFAGVTMALTGGLSPLGVVALAFGGFTIAATGFAARGGTVDLEFGGITMAVAGGHGPTGVGDLEFGGVSLGLTGLVIKVTGTAALAFGGIELALAGVVPTPAGTGLRQFWTFGN